MRIPIQSSLLSNIESISLYWIQTLLKYAPQSSHCQYEMKDWWWSK